MTTKNTACPSWFIYLVRTRSNALYCGITTDVDRRFKQHQTGKGAKFLRGKGPLTLVWSDQVATKSLALKYEIKVKKLPKIKKEQLIKNMWSLDSLKVES